MFVDSHAHIDGDEYDTDREEVLGRARAAGVRAILNVGTGAPESGNFERAVKLAEQYADVYVAIGVHPHDARLWDERAGARLSKLARKSERVIAWGEIGLDYHYDHSPPDTQREVFARQLRSARALDLPVVIHTREAEEDTIAILRAEMSDAPRAGMMHCFSGRRELADAALELGFMISFAGNVTFKNATSLREVARRIPLDRILTETDCPYLTPVPFRGRRNEPARVVEVARCLAELRGSEADAIGRQSAENFSRFFGVALTEGD